MKRCPQCRQTYTDETLKFCRNDGRLLQVNDSYPAESSETLILSDTRTSDALPTKLIQSEPTQAGETVSPTNTEGNLQRGGASNIHPTPGAKHPASWIERYKRGVIIVLSMIVLTAVGSGIWFFSSRRVNTKQIESIAVLPFINESGNADNEYLSDGMTESLINSLSRIPQLSVKARSSVFRYKGKETDLRKIAGELNVQAVLTGRV